MVEANDSTTSASGSSGGAGGTSVSVQVDEATNIGKAIRDIGERAAQAQQQVGLAPSLTGTFQGYPTGFDTHMAAVIEVLGTTFGKLGQVSIELGDALVEGAERYRDADVSIQGSMTAFASGLSSSGEGQVGNTFDDSTQEQGANLAGVTAPDEPVELAETESAQVLRVDAPGADVPADPTTGSGSGTTQDLA